MGAARPPLRVLAAALAAAAGGLLLVPAGGPPSPGQTGAAGTRAVVSFSAARLPVVAGVEVSRVLPAVGSAVVSGDARALAHLAATPGVRAVVPDAPLQLAGRLGERGGAVLAGRGLGRAAGAPGGGAGVRVAVVDTGVSDTAALDRASGRLVDAFDASGAPTGGALEDGHGHGTFMASLVAGGPVAGTGGRAVGVAPAATVLVVRVAGADGSTSLSQVLAGLDWVAGHPDEVDVASLSLSRPRPGPVYGPDPLTDAVAAVQSAGVPVVVASGNEPGAVSDPGFLPEALTVGAADVRTGEVAERSGSAVVAGLPKPDLVASGVSVLGVLPQGSLVVRAHPDAQVAEGLWRGSGTSQATAVTSGAVALLLAASPGMAPPELKAVLQANAQALDDRRAGAGLLRLPRRLLSGAAHGGPEADPEEGDWPAGSGSADSWSANSWSANSWSANSWSGNSWSANSWSANSWSANSWSAAGWGTP